MIIDFVKVYKSFLRYVNLDSVDLCYGQFSITHTTVSPICQHLLSWCLWMDGLVQVKGGDVESYCRNYVNLYHYTVHFTILSKSRIKDNVLY